MKERVTLGQFVAWAKRQGCEEHVKHDVVFGLRGAVTYRYLLDRTAQKRVLILPDADDHAQLAPDMLEHYIRVLGLEGFDDYMPDRS